MITDRLKKIIFDKLNEDLSHVELFLHKESIWFIDRKNKSWYLSFKSSGQSYWRWHFFVEFFELFSLERPEYEPLIKEWVEGVLKGGVTTTLCRGGHIPNTVEGVLKGGVTTTEPDVNTLPSVVEGVLKNGVTTTSSVEPSNINRLEGVLIGGIKTTISNHLRGAKCMEEILNNGTTI